MVGGSSADPLTLAMFDLPLCLTFRSFIFIPMVPAAEILAREDGDLFCDMLPRERKWKGVVANETPRTIEWN